ncbi:MAG: hypothetical protein FJY73_00035 [Candidatus Eisenbacteria bacterium]|nr:hypothetical protein [Candidatus Eisenbacteria bacterium]
MATTLKEIMAFLDGENLKYKPEEEKDFLVTGFRMENYQNPEGEKRLVMVVQLYEDGEFLEVLAPKAYVYKEGPHALAVFRACMFVSWRTKMIQYEYDPIDGEIRAVIEFPLEDSKLTKKQFMRVLMGLPSIIDRFHPVIQGAIDTGELKMPDDDEAAAAMQLFQLLEELKGQDPKVVKETMERISELLKKTKKKPPETL